MIYCKTIFIQAEYIFLLLFNSQTYFEDYCTEQIVIFIFSREKIFINVLKIHWCEQQHAQNSLLVNKSYMKPSTGIVVFICRNNSITYTNGNGSRLGRTLSSRLDTVCYLKQYLRMKHRTSGDAKMGGKGGQQFCELVTHPKKFIFNRSL